MTLPTQISLPDSSAVTNSILETMTSENAAALADVTLISSDNVRIPAVRMLLSIGSSFFRTLFSSEFAEKNSSEVTVSIASGLLRDILEFILTDDCDMIRLAREKQKQGEVINCKDISAILELADAADYTCVERLVSRCEEVVRYAMSTSPHTAATTVRTLEQGRLLWGKQLFNEALKICREKPKLALLKECDGCDSRLGLMHLDERSAEFVFSRIDKDKVERHDTTPADPKQEIALEQALFEGLVAWATGGTAVLVEPSVPHWANFSVSIDTDTLQIMETRLKPAKRLAHSFDISCFTPGFIANVIERSGLFEVDALLAAYRKRALELEDFERKCQSKSRRRY